jgi:hypothetical protein
MGCSTGAVVSSLSVGAGGRDAAVVQILMTALIHILAEASVSEEARFAGAVIGADAVAAGGVAAAVVPLCILALVDVHAVDSFPAEA